MTDIESIATEITKVASQFDKPIYASFMGQADVSGGIKILEHCNIPHYILPESMCKPFHTVYNFNHFVLNEKPDVLVSVHPENYGARKLIADFVEAGKKHLNEFDASQILEAYQMPVVEKKLAKSPNEAGKMAAEIGFPVVLKVISDDVFHKFDVGGVVLNVNTEEQAAQAFTEITRKIANKFPDATIRGIQVSRQIQNGLEVILGIKKDASFGAVVMFGFGGLFVEIFRDVSFRVAPVDKPTALKMIREIKSSELLSGARGTVLRDIDAIADSIVKLSTLATDCPQIKELDINPLIVLGKGKGCFVADAKIILEN